MRKKMKEILLTMSTFGVLIYLGRNPYLLEWLSQRYFCFIWAPILILWIFRQNIIARWLTFGAFGGMFVGQIIEDLKWLLHRNDQQPMHSSYWGVGTWIGAVIVCLLFGLLHTKIENEKKKDESPT